MAERRRLSIGDISRKENMNCTQKLFSPKPQKMSLFNRKLTLIPNFWKKKASKKMNKRMTGQRAKILICKKENDVKRREQIKQIFDSMDSKYSKFIKSEIQRKHKLSL